MLKNNSNKFWPFSFYLLFFAGAAAVFNFLALFFQSKGLTGSQIGILVGASSIVGLFAGPFWSSVADSSQRHRLVLSAAILGNVIAVSLYPFFNLFPVFLILVILAALFGGPVISMVDNAAMSMLGEERAMYGRVRLGGTIGWGLMAAVMGVIVERYGLRWNFLIYAGFMLLGLLVAQRLHFRPRPADGTFSSGIRQLLSDRKWIVFLTIVFFAGSGLAAVSAYFFIYLESIGTSPTWMGLSIMIATVAEFPALFFADRLMRRLGPRGLLTLGLAATALRCLLYGLIGIPWMALTAQLLQAVTFPILLVAGVSYADQNAPPGMGATAQSIFTSAFLGVAYAAGGFFGGVMLQYIGVRPMYLVFGTLIMLAALIFGISERRAQQAALVVGNQELGD